ncbi:hypothetical protein BD410DRAFT_441207 [Rickenella mellea]|uniref:F-box domain-containing protein n=1 Tax=Rickenella mellea TaxID=50990 RepID=A0A4Y7PVI4_9AGAM|nr:hypothetical protein BD410DRAFT_441207 [Rickenella mellea]
MVTRDADPDSEARLQILYSTLRELKSARDAIRPLLEIIENRVELFQKECNPSTLKLRFSNLPDDILQRIFEVGSTLDKYGGRFSVLVSHVCRRFRDVAFRTPRIWAFIHDSQPLDQISTFLRRSKAVDICVLVGYRGPRRRTDIEPFMNIVTQHSDRWFAFGCHVGDGEDEDMQRSLACLELILPNLTILAHSQELFEEPPGLGLFSSWVMPRLSEFHGSDITLQPSMLGENVTSCELDFDGSKDDDDYRTWNFTHVLHALKTACALSELIFR